MPKYKSMSYVVMVRHGNFWEPNMGGVFPQIFAFSANLSLSSMVSTVFVVLFTDLPVFFNESALYND